MSRRPPTSTLFPYTTLSRSDIVVSAGLSLDTGSLTMVDATHYTATVTADDGFTGTGTVSLAAGSYTDAALNLGGAGARTSTRLNPNPTQTADTVVCLVNERA